MSLINQMLKDLAQRSKPLADPNLILSGLVVTTNSKANKNKLHYGLLTGIIFLILILANAEQQPYSSAAHTLSLHQPILRHEPATKPTNPLPSSNLTMVTGITLNVQNEVTALRLLLDQNALYRVSSNGKDRLSIVLENTRLVANLPQIDTMSSAIKLVKMMTQADGSLKIILLLNPGSELSHLELNETGTLPELQINLSNKNMLDAAPQNLAQTEVAEEQQINTSIKKISYDTSVEEEYQQATRFSMEGKNNEAIALLTNFLKKYPEHIPARKSLATLLLTAGEYSEAQQIINVGLRLQPLYPPYIQLQAQLLVNKGKIKEALELLQTSPPSLEEYPEYHAFIAALYQRQNKPLLAEKLYEKLLNLQTDNSIWWMGLGIARESLNKNKEALEAYKNAVNTDNLNLELKVYVDKRIRELLL